MIKKLALSTLAAATLATASFADTYAGAGLALESVTDLDMGYSLVLNGGQTMDNIELGEGMLAIEGEFTYSMVAPSLGGYDFSTLSLAGYAAYIYAIDPQLYIKPRLGLIYRGYEATYGSYSATDSEIGIAYGIGGGYRLNEQMDVFADFTMLDGTDLTHLTFGVQYHY